MAALIDWTLQEHGGRPDTAADRGNRFLIGNGYLGVRGTLDEDGKDALAAVNLAGLYDQVGDAWREPLNAPNPFWTQCRIDAGPLTCAGAVCHTQSLDFRHGIAARTTEWQVGAGRLRVESERFVSMASYHLSGSAYTVTALDAPCRLTLCCGIDGDVWDINGPHYVSLAFTQAGDTLACSAATAANALVAVQRRVSWPQQGAAPHTEAKRGWQQAAIALQAGQSLRVTSVNAIYTTNDTPAPAQAAAEALAQAAGYDALRADHCRAWEELWRQAEIEIDGDDDACRAINYSVYHLNSIAPPPGLPLSIPARGLSGQTYKGAVFWDTEMFMLDHFLYTRPGVARSLLCYRIETLPGALEKARRYGLQGAFYAWESQEGGRDACSDHNVTDVFTGRPMRTYFKDKQVHISAAVARAVLLYTQTTGDTTLLAQGGARVVAECARFYWSLLTRPNATGRLEIHDVIGPDEYHERVNNNAYTNRCALAVFDWLAQAAALLQQADPAAYAALCADAKLPALLAQTAQARGELYLPAPNAQGVIEQFDGYFTLEDTTPAALRTRLQDPREYWGGAYGVASETQVIKQADVVAMLALFEEDCTPAQLRANWLYYEPRTEHGSSLSACMYALLACRFGDAARAYPFFLQSATAELRGGGKQWAGLVYIGGTHPAAAGGAWKVLAEGFAGLRCTPDGPRLHPCLPPGWQRLSFHFFCRGQRYHACVTPQGAELTPA